MNLNKILRFMLKNKQICSVIKHRYEMKTRKIRKIFCNIIKLLIICYVYISCFNCHTNKDKVQTIASIYNIDVDQAKEKGDFYLSSIVKSVRPILLEEPDYALIGDVYEIQVLDNQIFILDMLIAKKLFVYDMNGKFVRQIGVIGQGPGEYLGIWDFCIDSDRKEIYLFDYWRSKLLKHRISDGKYLHTINLPLGITYSRIAYCDNNIYASIAHDNLGESDNLLMKIDLKTEKFTEYISADIYNSGWTTLSHREFYKNKPLRYSGRYMNTVFAIENDTLYPYFTVKSKDWVQRNDILSDEKMKLEEDYDYEDIFNKKGRAFSIKNYIENDSCIHFEYRKETYSHIIYNKKTQTTYRYYPIIDDFADISRIYNSYYFWYVNSKFAYRLSTSEAMSSSLKKSMLAPDLAKQVEALKLEDEGFVILEYELK
jgi:hypothetical protein